MADNELANTDETKYVVTLEEVCTHMGYLLNEIEADKIIKRSFERLIKVADLYLQGAIGKNYPATDERAKEIALLIIADLYDNREFETQKMSNTARKLVNDLEWQLKLEMRNNGNEQKN